MNTAVTSKEEILKTSRELIRRQGWCAVSIRSVAAGCGVSVGSIYNYFDSKTDLIGATVESVWCEIFHRPEDDAVFRDVQVCVAWMYQRMAYADDSQDLRLCLDSTDRLLRHEERVPIRQGETPAYFQKQRFGMMQPLTKTRRSRNAGSFFAPMRLRHGHRSQGIQTRQRKRAHCCAR